MLVAKPSILSSCFFAESTCVVWNPQTRSGITISLVFAASVSASNWFTVSSASISRSVPLVIVAILAACWADWSFLNNFETVTQEDVPKTKVSVATMSCNKAIASWLSGICIIIIAIAIGLPGCVCCLASSSSAFSTDLRSFRLANALLETIRSYCSRPRNVLDRNAASSGIRPMPRSAACAM